MTDAQREIISLLQQIKAAAGGGGGAVDWGAITGTLSNQTDLQTQLDGKASLAQAAHSGGVIGVATFDAAGVAIANGFTNGVINVVGSAGIEYVSVGLYRINFTAGQPDLNYTVSVVGKDEGHSDWSFCYKVINKGTSLFEVNVTRASTDAPIDIDGMQVTVMRLSQ